MNLGVKVKGKHCRNGWPKGGSCVQSFLVNTHSLRLAAFWLGLLSFVLSLFFCTSLFCTLSRDTVTLDDHRRCWYIV